MRKAELEVGVDYAVTKGWPMGRARLDSLDGSERHPRRVRMFFYGDPDGRGRAREGQEVMVAPAHITARWDDPEQVAKRERRAELDRRSDRARELLAILGFTVAQPGRVRRFGEDPDPESWVQGGVRGRQVVIDLDAFLGLLDVPDPQAVASELRTQQVQRAERAREALRQSN